MPSPIACDALQMPYRRPRSCKPNQFVIVITADGAAIPWATSATLSLSGVTLRDGGASFRCVITGPGGTVISRDATLFVGSNLARSIEGLQLLYAFDEGAGAVVEDVSGVSPALDLEIASLPATHWLSGGLSIDSATILSAPGSATRLHTALGASNETTIEAWARPANITQTGPARIVTLSENSLLRNFTLGQRDSRWAMRVRTTIVTDNGLPELLSVGHAHHGASSREAAAAVLRGESDHLAADRVPLLASAYGPKYD